MVSQSTPFWNLLDYGYNNVFAFAIFVVSLHLNLTNNFVRSGDGSWMSQSIICFFFYTGNFWNQEASGTKKISGTFIIEKENKLDIQWNRHFHPNATRDINWNSTFLVPISLFFFSNKKERERTTFTWYREKISKVGKYLYTIRKMDREFFWCPTIK